MSLNKMVMHGQSDILEVLLGRTPELVNAGGEFNFFAPSTEREQALDMDIFEDNADLTLLDIVAGDQCFVEEVVPQSSVPEEVYNVTVTTSNEDDQILHDGESLVFQFPPTVPYNIETETTTLDASFLQSFACVSQPEDTVDSESLYSTSTVPNTPFSPSSPVFLPYGDTSSQSSTSADSTSGNVPAFVKEGLKMAIRNKRRSEGKGDIRVEFVPPAPEQLTDEEKALRDEKREKNKMAAQKCREKKRVRIDVLEAETRKLKGKMVAFQTEIQKLIEERDHLMDVISVHSQVCPVFRAQLPPH
ncbi:FOSX-like protein [Mya arenaria]|uniref:FOSX-like protein n=1 Tax=Mya arenaria TaxID=6604 RepID=A0ABY7FDU6_MYAAR|nr:FOSX-like protein [Mya arenaria]